MASNETVQRWEGGRAFVSRVSSCSSFVWSSVSSCPSRRLKNDENENGCAFYERSEWRWKIANLGLHSGGISTRLALQWKNVRVPTYDLTITPSFSSFFRVFFSQRFFCRHPSPLALHQIERMESFFHPAHLELSDEWSKWVKKNHQSISLESVWNGTPISKPSAKRLNPVPSIPNPVKFNERTEANCARTRFLNHPAVR